MSTVLVRVGAEWVEVPEVGPGEELPGRWLHLELRPETEGTAWLRLDSRDDLG